MKDDIEKQESAKLKRKEISTIEKNELLKTSYSELDKINDLEKLVDKLEHSTLASQFKENIYDKDEDGNIIESTKRLVFNKADMILCLGIGIELGMTPYVALSYGKQLNLSAVKKIEKGKSLGLDYATSLSKIYIWGEGTKEILYTGIEVVNSVLVRLGISKEIIQNGKVGVTYCRILATDKKEPFDLNIHAPIPNAKTFNIEQLATIINAASEKGKIAVEKDLSPTFTAEVKLSRFNKILNKIDTISIPYSSQEAIDAGLYRGINSLGEVVKGKDNWNNHLATHLIKMSIMIGARLIAPEVLGGMYIPEELSIVKANMINDFEDVEVIN